MNRPDRGGLVDVVSPSLGSAVLLRAENKGLDGEFKGQRAAG